MTANPSVCPSSASASATDSSAGPRTLAEAVFDSGCPECVDTDPAGSSTDTSSLVDGRTVMVQRRFSPWTARFAFVTRPFPTRSVEPSLSFA